MINCTEKATDGLWTTVLHVEQLSEKIISLVLNEWVVADITLWFMLNQWHFAYILF